MARSLLDRTRQLLADTDLSLPEIAEGAGDPVKYEWLKKFAGDYGSDPGVTRTQHLHDFLERRARRRRRALP